MCSLELDIDVVMIENMSLYAHELYIELGFRHMWIGPLVQIIFFIILFFELVNLYKAVIF